MSLIEIGEVFSHSKANNTDFQNSHLKYISLILHNGLQCAKDFPAKAVFITVAITGQPDSYTEKNGTLPADTSPCPSEALPC